MRFLERTVLILLAVALAAPLSAQVMRVWEESAPPPPPSVLDPAPRIWWIGPQLGAGLNTYSGTYTTKSCNCSFTDGDGTGFNIGVEVGHLFSPGIGAVVKLLYNDFSGASTNTVVEQTEVLDEATGTLETVPLTIERKLDAKLAYMTFAPMVHLYPFGGFYLLAGPGVGFNVTATQTYTRTILDEGYVFWNSGAPGSTVEGDTGDLPDASGLRVDVRAGIGYALRLGSSVLLAPEVTYVYPFTEVHSGDNWSVSSLHFTGVLRILL